MFVNKSAARLSSAIGGVAVAGSFLGFAALEAGTPFDHASTALPVFDTWGGVAVWTTLFFSLIAPNLLAAIGAFYLTTADERPASSVVVGFAIGGSLFGLGLVTAHWVVARPSVPLFDPYGWYAVVFLGVASLGALGGELVGPRVRKSV